MGVTLHGAGHGHSHGGGGGGHGHSHSGSSGSHSHEHSHNHSHENSHSESHELQISGKYKGGEAKSKMSKDLNVRAAIIHVLGDLVQSVGVFIAALLIYFKVGWYSLFVVGF